MDEHADLLRLSAATEGNDFRLGAAEAPPAIVSMYLGTKLENILQGIADGHLEKREEHREILMGSKSLPLLTADDNDRNRTTPFAFTGYKFEFRMVGSSQPLGFVNTIINALVTISFRDFARELETAENPLKKAYEIVGREYEAHKRVLFNGNGYTQEWVEEAARRGLPNLDCTIKAIPTLIRPENLAFLRKSKALTEEEAYARYEIMFTRYIQKINIELKVANDMVQKEILPAAISYCRQLAQGNFYCEQAGTVSGVAVKFQREIAQLTDEISDLCDEMHFARSSGGPRSVTVPGTQRQTVTAAQKSR